MCHVIKSTMLQNCLVLYYTPENPRVQFEKILKKDLFLVYLTTLSEMQFSEIVE